MDKSDKSDNTATNTMGSEGFGPYILDEDGKPKLTSWEEYAEFRLNGKHVILETPTVGAGGPVVTMFRMFVSRDDRFFETYAEGTESDAVDDPPQKFRYSKNMHEAMSTHDRTVAELGGEKVDNSGE